MLEAAPAAACAPDAELAAAALRFITVVYSAAADGVSGVDVAAFVRAAAERFGEKFGSASLHTFLLSVL
jgi:hypothetical protein